MSGLDLALIGNSSVAALLDAQARIVWSCLPRFDSDPAFCALLRPEEGPDRRGLFEVDLADFERSEQAYIAHTPILRTRLYDRHGGGVEIVDFAPRFQQFGRLFYPVMLMRQIRPLAGSPRIRVRLRPMCDYGARRPPVTWGSNHVRYVMPDMDLRLTTDLSITAVLEETPVVLREPVSLVLGPDETLHVSPGEAFRRFLDETAAWWRDWVRGLAISFEWQEPIIRAAITLKLNAYEDTGAIVAAVTTSIPESAGSGRNWDYRYCWLRDAYFVVNALNRLNATGTMERFLDFIINTAAGTNGADLQPVYSVTGKAGIAESEAPSLPGYRGMGPVRIGNQAYSQHQHDVYGAAVLAAAHVFFDARLALRSDQALFRQLERLGERAAALYDQPDAGLWELRGARHVHTFSSVMCWAACDRLAKIAARIGLEDRARHWRSRADAMHAAICERAWNAKRSSFASTFGGEHLDASLLLLHELDFLRPDDPRFAGTVRAVEKDLKRGDFVFRYTQPDDFGVPDNAFAVCTFWYVDALASLGRAQQARSLFESLIARCNQHGLLSEHIEPATGELWGNFPQTYSMVGLINSAMRLSISWDQAF
ncbi:MAG TPA: glycoside hydrolase family 15 protein [Burkholderiales bacterium]|nr:glycoside hydrolase family 15 protein [Burkholderiales bacterium]